MRGRGSHQELAAIVSFLAFCTTLLLLLALELKAAARGRRSGKEEADLVPFLPSLPRLMTARGRGRRRWPVFRVDSLQCPDASKTSPGGGGGPSARAPQLAPLSFPQSHLQVRREPLPRQLSLFVSFAAVWETTAAPRCGGEGREEFGSISSPPPFRNSSGERKEAPTYSGGSFSPPKRNARTCGASCCWGFRV